MLGFAGFFPNPTEFQIRVFVTTLALAAGGVGAMLPGLIKWEHAGVLGTVRATGAIVLAGVVYFMHPTLVEKTVTLIPPDVSPEPVAEAFLKSVDTGDYKGAYVQIDPAAIGQVIGSEKDWLTISDKFRKPLGPPVLRELTGSRTFTSQQQEPIGVFRSLVYRTRFSNETQCRMEQLDLRGTQQRTWRVFSYLISPTYVPC